jgi:hypothetical protein
MAFKNDGPISFDLKENGINELIDERNNTVMMLREVSWNGRQEHLELRKWIVGEEGERPNKGVVFMTEEGPHNLVNVMTKLGYGDTKTVLGNLKDRADFEPALVETIGMQKVVQAKNSEVEVSEDDYFDPRSMTLG